MDTCRRGQQVLTLAGRRWSAVACSRWCTTTTPISIPPPTPPPMPRWRSGLNIVVGFAGLLDLGYAAFFAIGAYAYGILTSFQVMPQWRPVWEPFAWLDLVQRDPAGRRRPGAFHRLVLDHAAGLGV